MTQGRGESVFRVTLPLHTLWRSLIVHQRDVHWQLSILAFAVFDEWSRHDHEMPGDVFGIKSVLEPQRGHQSEKECLHPVRCQRYIVDGEIQTHSSSENRNPMYARGPYGTIICTLETN